MIWSKKRWKRPPNTWLKCNFASSWNKHTRTGGVLWVLRDETDSSRRCWNNNDWAKAGCPTTIVPFFGDQFFWGDMIYERGLGPAPIPIAQLNVENLSNSIGFMLQPEVKSRVMELAKVLENEDGVAAAVDAFHRNLPPELPL
ncbi:unnamed protein product [Arabis nemorensis]|uniref:Uncharacterized protein n=1 Tax=Arabis nemorensis TaxID=586526 RepID=A0A565CCU5_9BRAS|nr:unnamed protein product [Arabis nemorensis]